LCAELFVKNLYDMKAYRDMVMKRFSIYSLVFKFIQLKIAGKFNMARYAYDLVKIYNHMKSEQSRYGMEIKISDMIKISKI